GHRRTPQAHIDGRLAGDLVPPAVDALRRGGGRGAVVAVVDHRGDAAPRRRPGAHRHVLGTDVRIDQPRHEHHILAQVDRLVTREPDVPRRRTGTHRGDHATVHCHRGLLDTVVDHCPAGVDEEFVLGHGYSSPRVWTSGGTVLRHCPPRAGHTAIGWPDSVTGTDPTLDGGPA